MKPGSVKIAIIGLVAAVSFLALLQWAIGAYSRQELERLTEKEQADFRAHLQTEHLRVIDRRLERLEQKLIFGNALPDPALQPSSGMTEGTRHYFGLCHDDGLARLSAGMTAVAARDLCSGREYAPFETVRNGFTFALDDARTQFFNFVGWMPQGDAQYDFFNSEKTIVRVDYDKNGNVSLVTRESRDKVMSPEGAGAMVRQKNDRSLELMVAPR